MEGTPIIKMEAVTISQKILDQIESHKWDQEMERWLIGWCVDRRGTILLGKSLEGRYFKCWVFPGSSFDYRVNLSDIKNNYPQIFIK